MALTTTVGGASSDSYISAADAATFFASLGLFTDWSTYGGETSLLRAMTWVESRQYMGSRANNDSGSGVYQALEYPRSVTFYVGADIPYSGTTWTDKRGRRWTDTEIPTPIKHAQCWAAMAEGLEAYFRENEPSEKMEFSAGSVTIRGGVLSGQFQKKITEARRQAVMLLRPFLASENGRTIRS